MNFFAHLSHCIGVQHGVTSVKDPPDTNAGVAEQPLASAGVSALLWSPRADCWGDFINNEEKSFQKEGSHLIVTWEMGCAGALGLLQLSAWFQLSQGALWQKLQSQQPVRRAKHRDLRFSGNWAIRKA